MSLLDLRRALALAHKEALHVVRDLRVLYMALGMPVLLLLLFGYAVSFELDRLALGVLDHDRSSASRSLVERFAQSGSFAIAGGLAADEDVPRALRRGAVSAVLVVPRGYARHLARGEPADVQLVVDASNGTTASVALADAEGIAAAHTARAIPGRSPLPPGLVMSLAVRANPAMRSAWFVVPGLIAMILSIMAVLLTAVTVAREWERGSMEQLFSTPVLRVEIVLGKLLPYVVLGMVQVVIVVALGAVVLGVPVRGSIALLFAVSALFLTGMVGQGMLVSIVTRNQLVATQAGIVSSLLPTILLSGFLSPIENMPAPLQVLSTVIPSRYFIQVLRRLMLDGAGVGVLWPSIAPLGAYAIVMLAAAILAFRRRLD